MLALSLLGHLSWRHSRAEAHFQRPEKGLTSTSARLYIAFFYGLAGRVLKAVISTLAWGLLKTQRFSLFANNRWEYQRHIVTDHVFSVSQNKCGVKIPGRLLFLFFSLFLTLPFFVAKKKKMLPVEKKEEVIQRKSRGPKERPMDISRRECVMWVSEGLLNENSV